MLSWNCRMAYLNKKVFLNDFDADIKVIQECSKESVNLNSSLWFGDSPTKGIGIEFKRTINYRIAPYFSSTFKWIVPIEVKLDSLEFILIAVWLKLDRKYAYSGAFIQTIKNYLPFLENKMVIVIGDFNSNCIWDKKHQSIGNHSELVRLLEEFDIHSVYHTFSCEQQGKETVDTFYRPKKVGTSFHIDYCFASGRLINNIENFEIGEYSKWIDKSDHMPLMISLKTYR